jgi:hypothetical protein
MAGFTPSRRQRSSCDERHCARRHPGPFLPQWQGQSRNSLTRQVLLDGLALSAALGLLATPAHAEDPDAQYFVEGTLSHRYLWEHCHIWLQTDAEPPEPHWETVRETTTIGQTGKSKRSGVRAEDLASATGPYQSGGQRRPRTTGTLNRPTRRPRSFGNRGSAAR